MLQKLHISNYALIEEVEVLFPQNLAIVTGETGAGKSIFLEALSLVLGSRADVGVLQNKGKKCIVEAEFELKNYSLNDFFLNHDLDYEDKALLRREINPEGKSRAFINDSPVTLSVLKELGEKLVDIHSQHETLLLNQSEFQFEVIDSVAGITNLSFQYKKLLKLWNQKKKMLLSLQEKEANSKKDFDYFQFLFSELNDVQLKSGELQKLEEESASLENAELIKSALLKCTGIIAEDESNLLQALSLVKQQLNQLAKFGASYKSLAEKANSLYLELKELSSELTDTELKVAFHPARLEEINEKLDKINRLLKKHNAKSEEDLQRIKDEIEGRLNQIGTLEKEIIIAEKECGIIRKEIIQLSDEIHQKRKSAIPVLEKEIKNILSSLSMPNANFKAELSEVEEPGTYGISSLKFLFSANKGSDFKELHKVASGGELSRLMLAIKSILASKKALPTIIFDEIDTGVSGDVADKIGQILLKMSEKMQVISITHLPQIACKGKFHLFVFKNEKGDKTISHIKELNKDERVVEIAKMLSTGKPGESAIKNAKDLLGVN